MFALSTHRKLPGTCQTQQHLPQLDLAPPLGHGNTTSTPGRFSGYNLLKLTAASPSSLCRPLQFMQELVKITSLPSLPGEPCGTPPNGNLQRHSACSLRDTRAIHSHPLSPDEVLYSSSSPHVLRSPWVLRTW